MYSKQQSSRRNMDIKQKLQNLIDQQEDPRILAELYDTVNRIFNQKMPSRVELNSNNSRFNNITAEEERKMFAHSWLERKNPQVLYATHSKRSNLDSY